MADLMATAPSLGAGTVRKEPLNCATWLRWLVRLGQGSGLAHFGCRCSRGTQDVCVSYFMLEGCSCREAPCECGTLSTCDGGPSAVRQYLPEARRIHGKVRTEGEQDGMTVVRQRTWDKETSWGEGEDVTASCAGF